MTVLTLFRCLVGVTLIGVIGELVYLFVCCTWLGLWIFSTFAFIVVLGLLVVRFYCFVLCCVLLVCFVLFWYIDSWLPNFWLAWKSSESLWWSVFMHFFGSEARLGERIYQFLCSFVCRLVGWLVFIFIFIHSFFLSFFTVFHSFLSIFLFSFAFFYFVFSFSFSLSSSLSLVSFFVAVVVAFRMCKIISLLNRNNFATLLNLRIG